MLSCVVALSGGTALAAEDPPGLGVDHSQERYTLDGREVPRPAAESGARICVASPDESRTVACFTSVGKLGRASVDALRAGKLPLGYGAIPPGVSRGDLLRSFEAFAQRDQVTPPIGSAARSSGHRRLRGGGRPVATAADGYSCRSDPYTYIWNGANYTSTSGTMGFTGATYWRNYSGTYDNQVSSFWGLNGATTRWHDYANGQGAYYGGGYSCRYIDNFGNANMTDGGTANDRFSSWIIY